MSKAFTIKSGKIKIVGRLYSKNPDKLQPTIILSHEFGLNMLSTSRYAKRLCNAGYHVFIYDFPGSGSGASRGRKSAEMSVITEKQDLGVVFEYVKSQPFVDHRHIVLGGASQGGLVTALFAAEHVEEIEKVFLYYPALCIPDDARRGCIIGKDIDPDNVPNEFTAMGYVRLGKKYVDDAKGLDPWKDMEPYDKPVLICHGTKDGIVSFEYAVKASQVYKNAKLIRFDGAKHCFAMPQTVNRAVAETIGFLKDKLDV